MLDQQDVAQAARDRHAIASALGHAHQLRSEHQASHEEPLLWAVDGRRRVDRLIPAREIRL